mgnify:CR=1 FL=1
MNTPNKISFSRLFFAILMIIIYSLNFLPSSASFAPNFNTTGFNWIDLTSAIIFIIGSITDFVDGKIARKKNLITDLGKFIDPLADKFLVDSAFILLACKRTIDGHFYLWPFIVVLFVGRDLAVDGLRMIANSKKKVLAANIYGKIKTVMEMIIIPIIFLSGLPFSYFNGKGEYEYTYLITNSLAILTLIMSLVSGIIYFKQNIDVLKEEKKWLIQRLTNL